MRVRLPAVAGLFYPDDEAAIERFMKPYVAAPKQPALEVFALVGPHAGYVYSGAICGEGYARVRVPDVAVVLGPNHTGMGSDNAVWARGAFAIPGGEVPIEEALACDLAEAMGLVDDERAHRREHSIEVHLPFLRAKNRGVRVVPICLGHLPYDACEKMGRGLARVLRARSDVMVVVSTDMSHYISAEEASRLDRLALDRVRAADPRGLFDTVRQHRISMCGFIPTTVALVAACELGRTKADLVRYGNSGETSGDLARVVGYASATLA
jgi:AmmeMemoRadiSam system protein B